MDQTALAEVIGSGQQSARVTFVRVDDGGMSTIENQVDLDASELMQAVGAGQTDANGANVTDVVDPAVNLGLLLDPEQLNKLDKVLETDEAKNLLGDAMTVEDKVHEETPEPVIPPGPMRRSQRQVDRETRQTAEKIRAQNQEIMKKEDSKGKKSAAKSPPNRGRGGSRPTRQRKVPKHLADDDMVTETKEEDNEGEEGEEEEDKNEENSDEESDSGSWASEDDPDRFGQNN